MKIILPILLVFAFSTSSVAQQDNNMQNFFADTASYTVIETALRQKGVIQKVEFVNNSYIGGIYLGIIRVRNLQTGDHTKGIYFSNVSPVDHSIFYTHRERKAYIDESELDGLIAFFANCDSVWKKDRPEIATSYEFETKDRFRIRFSAEENSQAWRFVLQFRNYYFFNSDSFSKRKSTSLYETLRTFKEVLSGSL